MTKTELVQLVHRLYTKDTDYPDASTDDYALYLDYLDMAVDTWGKEIGIKWKELVSTQAITTVDGDNTYSLATDFSQPIGYLRIYDSSGFPVFYRNIPSEQAHLYENGSPSILRYYITGTNGAYTLNVYPTPSGTTAGLSGKLDYYKDAKTVTALTTDDIEMSDPMYAVHFAVAKLFADDEDNTQASFHLQIAADKIKSMRLKNEAVIAFQDNTIDDYTGGFGL